MENLNIDEKTKFLVDGFIERHSKINNKNYVIDNMPILPFRFICTSPNHHTGESTVKIQDTEEMEQIIEDFKRELYSKYDLLCDLEDVRFFKQGNGYLSIQYLM